MMGRPNVIVSPFGGFGYSPYSPFGMMGGGFGGGYGGGYGERPVYRPPPKQNLQHPPTPQTCSPAPPSEYKSLGCAPLSFANP